MVGVGASAGGLEALERFFDALPRDLRAAFIVVQHLSPDHKSLMVDLLAKHTSMPVREAAEGTRIEAGTVSMVPPHANLEVEGDRLRLRERVASHSPNLPINLLFRSMAERYGERAVGVVLSGTGSDGRLGIEAIKQAGGLVLVQEPSTARFDGMPLAAISTGLADAVVPPQAMAEELLAFVSGGASPQRVRTEGDVRAMDSIQSRLLRISGIDFAEYKPPTVLRRIARRMAQLQLDSLGEYAQRLEHDEAEVQTLSRELLINVTQFFREPEVFSELQDKVLPGLVARAGRETVRVWVPGCSTGQEAYTLAMLLAEANPPGGFKIFATDADTAAIEQAALGRYSEAQLIDVPPERRSRFFHRQGEAFEVDRELRRRVVFAPHNVARDPPFTRLDLVSCRNLLIYLSVPLQKRVLATFSFALKTDGVMVLGSSESLGEVADRFRTIDGHLKLYQRLPGPRVPMPSLPGPFLSPRTTHVVEGDHQQALDSALQLLIDKVAPAAVLVNERLEVLRVFGNVERLLSVATGAATLALLPMLPESLRTLTSMATQRALSLGAETVMAVAPGDLDVGSLRAQPFTGARGERYLVITFERASAPVFAASAIPVSDEAQRQIAELQRELHFVRESLQATIEELETSNEELRATNEELLAANEELQSTNEELQSVNEEMNTVNAEHQAKIAELVAANEDLDNLFNSSPVGIVFLDDRLQVRRFTPAMTQQFSLLTRDLGRPVDHITHQFKDFDFTDELRRVQRSAQTSERELQSHAGQRYLLRISPYLKARGEITGLVATFVDVTQLRGVQEEREALQRLIDTMTEQVVVVGADGLIRFVNRAWSQSARVVGEGLEVTLGPGANYLEACRDEPLVREQLGAVLSGQREHFAHEYPCHSPTEQRWFVMNASRLADGRGAVITHTNVTQQRARGRTP